MAKSRNPSRASAHQVFGGGYVADIVLWRKWSGSVLVVISSTSLWLMFKHGEYNLLSFIVNILLFLVLILFFWAKFALLLNRPFPPIPDLEIHDAFVEKAVEIMHVWINRTLSIAHKIAVGGSLQVLVQVAITMSIISIIGSLTDFVTFVYISVLLSLSLPKFYEKYQDPFDEVLYLLRKIVQVQWRNFDRSILSKIPIHKEKKTH